MLLLLLAIADNPKSGKIMLIHDKYHGNMLRYARSLLRWMGDKNYVNDGEDVVQNSYIKISKSIDRIDTSLPENVLGGYIMEIVKHEAVKFLKKQRIDVSLDEMLTICEECSFVEEFAKKEQYIRVVNEIDKLDAKYRDVLRMSFIENMSIGEIAKVLKIPEKTVYTRRSRGIMLLKKVFKDEVL